ncbi:hypothetical protein RAA17_19970 [Komagataeibacter rhaeticus]|nr:hypothetical protein [Komagataeibacter rhaeticus]
MSPDEEQIAGQLKTENGANLIAITLTCRHRRQAMRWPCSRTRRNLRPTRN